MSLPPEPRGARPVRIASLIKRLHIGGDQVRLLSFAAAVDRERFEHVVIVVEQPDEQRDATVGPMLGAFRAAGVEVVVLGHDIESVTATPRPTRVGLRRRVADVGAGLATLRQVVTLLREREVDVVDARLNFGTLVGLLAARVARVPVVVSTGYFTAHWRRPRLIEPFGQLAFRLIDAFVTDADATVAEFDRWRWSRHARLVMIPNGVPPALPTRAVADVRADLGLPGDPAVRVVGAICRMIPGKGYETLLHAARTVLEQEPDVAVLCCGFAEDPAYRASLEALAGSLGIAGSVVFASYPGPVGDAMGVLDVYARVSTEDSSPIGVHEAMSAGVPLLLTDVGGARELVDHERTGLLVPPGDAPAVAAAVLRLLRDPELAQRLREEGRREYAARFTPAAMARAHEELFLDLLAGRRHGGRRVARGRWPHRRAPAGPPGAP